MNKVKYVRLEKEDGTYSESIPLSVDADQINMSNGKDLQEIIGNIDVDTDGNVASQLNNLQDTIGDINIDEDGNIASQLNDLNNNKINISDIIDNLNTEQSNKPLSAKQGYELNNVLNNALNTKINFQYHLYQPSLSTTQELGCFNILSFNNGFNILCDCGMEGQEDAIDLYLNNKNIDYFDIVIITHFHGDHVGNFEHIVRNYCDSKTKFFRQMEWDGTRLSDGKALETAYTELLTSLGYINNSRVPAQNETILVNNNLVKLRFLNTDSSFLESYYTAHSDTNLNNYLKASLNNLSLICEVSCGNQTILWTGDIEQQAQKNNYSFLRKVDILQIPHHNWNKNGYYKFFQNASPTIGYYNRNTYVNFFNSYWHRYQRQCSGYIPTYYTYDSNHVEIAFDNSGIQIQSGFQDDNYNTSYERDTLLADLPSYEDDVHDYWSYPLWKIDDIISLISYFRNKGKEWTYTLSSSLTEFNEEIKTITEETNTNMQWYITLLDKGFELKRSSNWTNRQFMFLQGFKYEIPTTWSNYLIDSTIPFSNHSKNTSLTVTVNGGRVSLTNQLRKPQMVFIAVIFNGITYYKVLHMKPNSSGNTQTDEYEMIETKVTSSTIETININMRMGGDYIILRTCEQNIYNITNNTVTTYSGMITECSSCIYN